ncbi:SMP-30/gluconolactonase/LRE family protein [Williamsia maris]|uniref:SMP-30/Gluconolaconase/LRE-like region-containing protein n=1 Tax=Williamsia maris TaxID=72806 RepID=A0ABT1HJH5_9NOCA|nr:SMP-30/gluconolactonase/LRE family protein [Williamsia maris]MCP2178096.1 SMP-30/Gluconolaconase/LRE-like region-containing protein [Williamsia maris]
MNVRAKLSVSRSRVAITLIVAATAVGLITPSAASAAPSCEGVTPQRATTVARLGGWIESIVVDEKGRLFATDLYRGRVYRIDHPGATPRVLADFADGVILPGGVVVRPDGKLLVGTYNYGPITANARVLLIDPDTGSTSVYASGLIGIDGVALAPDGTVYTSTLISTAIGRVTPAGQVTPHWTDRVVSPNGIAVSPDGRYLYAIQTWPSPSLYRIPVNAPHDAAPWIRSSHRDFAAAPDGLTVDSQGRPLVTTHLSGQVWRVDADHFCSVSVGADRRGTTQVTYGHGTQGFSHGRLFRTGVYGEIDEVPSAFDPGGR